MTKQEFATFVAILFLVGLIAAVARCECPHGKTVDGKCYVGSLMADQVGILIINAEDEVVGICHHVEMLKQCKPTKHHSRKEMYATFQAIHDQLWGVKAKPISTLEPFSDWFHLAPIHRERRYANADWYWPAYRKA